jgi:hypothetical protein
MNIRKNIEDSFENIASKISELDTKPGSLCAVYLEGETSLFLNGVVPTFRGIEWFISERWLKLHDIDIVNCNNTKFNVDIQTKHLENFIPDYAHNSKLEKSTTYNGIIFEFRSLAPEVVYLKKLDVGRDQDFEDLAKISEFITPASIVEALNASFLLNSDDTNLNIASQALSEISYNYFLDLKPNEIKEKTQSLINDLSLNEYLKNMIANSFGVNRSTNYSLAKDPWANKPAAKNSQYSDLSI